MNINTRQLRNDILAQLEQGRLHDAFATLRRTSEQAMAWEITSQAGSLEENYAYMLKYFVDGADDPNRKAMYDDIVRRALRLVDVLVRHIDSTERPTLYFNTLRSQRMRTAERLPAMADDYRTHLANIALAEDAGNDIVSMLAQAESLERDIFDRVWTTFPLQPADTAAIESLLHDPTVAPQKRCMIVGAVMAGELEYHDDSRVKLLIGTYSKSDDASVALAALVGLVFALYRHRDIEPDAETTAMLGLLKDSPEWHRDLTMLFLELIRTRDTEALTRRMNEEIIPSMIRVSSDIKRKLDSGEIDPDMLADMEINPEWEKIIDKSGITDTLKQMTDIQQDGGDVFMATFSGLKSLPFFSHMANWFMPFTTAQSDVMRADPTGDFAKVIASADFLCDNDKYSAILSLSSIPDAQRRAVLSQFSAQNVMQQASQSAVDDTAGARRRRFVNKYLQSLYRFYKLFRRKGDFYDPFGAEANLLDVRLLADDFNDVQSLQAIGEFFFRFGCWSDAARTYRAVDALDTPRADTYQKLGYCYEKTSDINLAVTYYEQALMLDDRSVWTLRRLAACHRRRGDASAAASTLRVIDRLEPDNAKTIVALAAALVESGNYDEGVKMYFKAQYLAPESMRARRGLAFSLFMMKRFDEAAKAYESLICDDNAAGDYLNAGHVALAMNRTREALNFYKIYMSAAGLSQAQLIDAVKADERYLTDAGIDPQIMPLIIDALQYSLDIK